MSVTANDRLVAGYLDQLRTATADLPAAERDELVANIAEHIAMSVAEVEEPTEAHVRTVLDRLGDPEAIAAEAHGQSSRTSYGSPPDPVAAARPGALEWGGVAMLGIGSYLLPVIGTVAGLVMISMSRWWSTRQKVVAAVLSLAGAIVVPLVGIGLFLTSSDQPGPAQPAPVVASIPASPPADPTQSPR